MSKIKITGDLLGNCEVDFGDVPQFKYPWNNQSEKVQRLSGLLREALVKLEASDKPPMNLVKRIREIL